MGFPSALYARSIPPDNPQTPAKIALGQALFVEQRLSADNLQHCEGCHNYALGFTDQKTTSVGIDGQTGRRNAPTILNAMFNTSQFWDGRAATLEDQAKSPILNPIEMGMKSPDEVVAKIEAMPQYREAFERVFGREVTFDDIAPRPRIVRADANLVRLAVRSLRGRRDRTRLTTRRSVDGKSSTAPDDAFPATSGPANVHYSLTAFSTTSAYQPVRRSRTRRLRCVLIATTRRSSIASRPTAA